MNDDEANRDSFWPMSMAKVSQTACTYQDDREVLKVRTQCGISFNILRLCVEAEKLCHVMMCGHSKSWTPSVRWPSRRRTTRCTL